MTSAPATQFARAARRWEPLDWWRLEARAWQHEPDVRRALAFFSPATVWRELAMDVNPNPLVVFVMLISHLIGLCAPVLGAFALMPWVRGDADTANVTLAGVLAGAGALSAGTSLFMSAQRRSLIDPRSARVIAILHALPSGAALAIALAAITQGVADGPAWIVAIVVDAAVGIAILAMFRAAPSAGSDRWRRNLERLRAAIDAVDAEEQMRVTADIAGAIDVLEAEGRVTPDEAALAREAALGALGNTLAPREDLIAR